MSFFEQLGVGFAAGYEGLRHKDKVYGNETVSGGMAGFGLDLQAKLFPHSMVSPLVGFQYMYRTMGQYKGNRSCKKRLCDEWLHKIMIDKMKL